MLSEQLLNNTSTTRVELESAPTRTARRASLTVHSKGDSMWGSAGTNSPGPAPPKTALSRTAPARVSDDQNASSRDRGRRSVRPALALARSRTDHARTAPRLYTGRIYCATLKVISNAKSVKQISRWGACVPVRPSQPHRRRLTRNGIATGSNIGSAAATV